MSKEELTVLMLLSTNVVDSKLKIDGLVKYERYGKLASDSLLEKGYVEIVNKKYLQLTRSGNKIVDAISGVAEVINVVNK